MQITDTFIDQHADHPQARLIVPETELEEAILADAIRHRLDGFDARLVIPETVQSHRPPTYGPSLHHSHRDGWFSVVVVWDSADIPASAGSYNVQRHEVKAHLDVCLCQWSRHEQRAYWRLNRTEGATVTADHQTGDEHDSFILRLK